MKENRLYSLDSDLPNFSPTKYNSRGWRLWHSGTYLIFSICTFMFLFNYSYFTCSCYIIGSLFYLLSSFTEYIHFQRGCIGLSNLNSELKTNRKKNCKTILKRSEYGVYYFLSVICGFMLLVESIIFFIAFYFEFKNANDHNPILEWKPNVFYSQFVLMTFMLMFIVQLLKIGKITLKTQQYSYKKDKSNVIKESFGLIGSFCYILGFSWYLIIYTNRQKDSFPNIPQYSFIGGSVFFFLSTISLIVRYFFSGYADLNMEGMSFVTV